MINYVINYSNPFLIILILLYYHFTQTLIPIFLWVTGHWEYSSASQVTIKRIIQIGAKRVSLGKI